MTSIIEVRKIERRLKELRITDFNLWVGETVATISASVYEPAKIVIAFQSGKWSLINICRGYEPGDDTISLSGEFNSEDYMDRLVELDLATVEERDIVVSYFEETRRDIRRQQELAQLQRLKEKYEGSRQQ